MTSSSISLRVILPSLSWKKVKWKKINVSFLFEKKVTKYIYNLVESFRAFCNIFNVLHKYIFYNGIAYRFAQGFFLFRENNFACHIWLIINQNWRMFEQMHFCWLNRRFNIWDEIINLCSFSGSNMWNRPKISLDIIKIMCFLNRYFCR